MIEKIIMPICFGVSTLATVAMCVNLHNTRQKIVRKNEIISAQEQQLAELYKENENLNMSIKKQL